MLWLLRIAQETMGGRRLRSFFTALQFLTRIHLVEQRDLTAADFGRSTRCFPLVDLPKIGRAHV